MNDIMISDNSVGIDSLDGFFAIRVADCVSYCYKNGIAGDKRYRSLSFKSFYGRYSSFINRCVGDDALCILFTSEVCARMHMLYGYPDVETIRILSILFNDRGFISVMT